MVLAVTPLALDSRHLHNGIIPSNIMRGVGSFFTSCEDNGDYYGCYRLIMIK